MDGLHPHPEDSRPPLPRDPLEHRQEAERLLPRRADLAVAHALLAIAGELAQIRRQMGKR
ncbi:hypothetical protein ACIQJT_02440 [Streptomyces sp. NPDC091972]|uniref:hypothetical protein n=1 Tax=Streptomyces sp. NPDC091972 TaxID=3366007 RepID=UPI00380CF30E